MARLSKQCANVVCRSIAIGLHREWVYSALIREDVPSMLSQDTGTRLRRLYLALGLLVLAETSDASVRTAAAACIRRAPEPSNIE